MTREYRAEPYQGQYDESDGWIIVDEDGYEAERPCRIYARLEDAHARLAEMFHEDREALG